MKDILIIGLPGSGKTYLASGLADRLNAIHINADAVRTIYDDWDFSIRGRARQAKRMASFKADRPLVLDFICPLEKFRELFVDYYIIWMDTISLSEYDDTDRLFETPVKYNLRIDNIENSIDVALESLNQA